MYELSFVKYFYKDRNIVPDALEINLASVGRVKTCPSALPANKPISANINSSVNTHQSEQKTKKRRVVRKWKMHSSSSSSSAHLFPVVLAFLVPASFCCASVLLQYQLCLCPSHPPCRPWTHLHPHSLTITSFLFLCTYKQQLDEITKLFLSPSSDKSIVCDANELLGMVSRNAVCYCHCV